MGRPRMSQAERRAIKIMMRVSDLELKKLKRPETESLAAFIRTQALNLPLPPPVPEPNRLALKLLLEHARVINEAAHAANMGQPIGNIDLPELLSLLRYLIVEMESRAFPPASNSTTGRGGKER